MKSILRSGLAALAITVSALSGGILQAQQSTSCLRLVKWPGIEQETPAICIVRSGWYFCMLPGNLEKENITPPQLRSGISLLKTRILQIDPVHRVCLIESLKSPDKTDIDTEDIPVKLSIDQENRPGTLLTSTCPGHSCRTRIAGKDQQYLGKELTVPLIRVRLEDASLCQPGMPLLNPKGELVALLTERKLRGEKEAHAIPASVLRKMLTDYQNHHRTGPVWIGTSFEAGNTTLEVLKVRANSPAERGGVQTGDIVLSINGTSVKSFPDLLEIFQTLPAGKAAKFTVLRGMDEKELSLIPEFIKESK